jgi:hypothetical protein
MNLPDARHSTPGNSWKERRHAPRHADVWVRAHGTWQRGRIIEWVQHLGEPAWEVVVVAEDKQAAPPWQGRFVFDPKSIRPRWNDTPPK